MIAATPGGEALAEDGQSTYGRWLVNQYEPTRKPTTHRGVRKLRVELWPVESIEIKSVTAKVDETLLRKTIRSIQRKLSQTHWRCDRV